MVPFTHGVVMGSSLDRPLRRAIRAYDLMSRVLGLRQAFRLPTLSLFDICARILWISTFPTRRDWARIGR